VLHGRKIDRLETVLLQQEDDFTVLASSGATGLTKRVKATLKMSQKWIYYYSEMQVGKDA